MRQGVQTSLLTPLQTPLLTPRQTPLQTPRQNPLQTPVVKQEWAPPSGGLRGGLGQAGQPPPKQPLGVLVSGEQVSCCPHGGHDGVLPRVGTEPTARSCGSLGAHMQPADVERQVGMGTDFLSPKRAFCSGPGHVRRVF